MGTGDRAGMGTDSYGIILKILVEDQKCRYR